MSPMERKRIPTLSFLSGTSRGDPDIQAGSHGMSVEDVVKTYLRTPGHFLALLRFNANERVEIVAAKVGIPAGTLTNYEKGVEIPSLQHLALLSRHFNADLRVVLGAFGHVSQGAASTSMGLAAQFDGELSAKEKLDLKNLVQSIVSKKEM